MTNNAFIEYVNLVTWMGYNTKINKYEHQIEHMISFCHFNTAENQICNKQLFTKIGMLFMIADLCLKNKQSNCVKKKKNGLY